MWAQEGGTCSGAINPLTSGVSTTAHVGRTAEAHGIGVGVMRAAEGCVRRTVALGKGAVGVSRLAEVLGRR
ncbi:hypothetical protein [Kitasatospora sp. NPDC005748]|uniref:imine reductase family protein n=1 Tax=Kitasatospora sp. NPDC005748 TaxID=3157063 RepID=UPI00340625D4